MPFLLPAPWHNVKIPNPSVGMHAQRKNLLRRLSVVQVGTESGDGKKFNKMAYNMHSSENNFTGLSVAECKVLILTSLVDLVLSGDIKTKLCCPDTLKELQFFEIDPRGSRFANPLNASPDRFCEKEGYERHNICWRSWGANNGHVPKLKGLRTCHCGRCSGVTKPNEDFVLAALAQYPVSDIEWDSDEEEEEDESGSDSDGE